MIFWHGYGKRKIEKWVHETHTAAYEVMKEPAGGIFVLYRVRLTYIFINEAPVEHAQAPTPDQPPTVNEGCAFSSQFLHTA